MLELLPAERTAELLLERMLELLLLERIVAGLLERLADGAVERTAVLLLRVGVATVLLVRVDAERVAVDTLLLRDALVPRLTEVPRVAVPRVAVLSPRPLAVRTLLLPKVRDAVPALRVETRVADALLSVPTREALRTAVWRLRSKLRALL
jgi:hypothetical protein